MDDIKPQPKTYNSIMLICGSAQVSIDSYDISNTKELVALGKSTLLALVNISESVDPSDSSSMPETKALKSGKVKASTSIHRNEIYA